MTSMKSFELASLGTNRYVPLIGHETLSYLMLARDPWIGRKTSQGAVNTRGSSRSSVSLFVKLIEKAEIYLERKRILRELQSLDDRMLKDIGIVRAEIESTVNSASIEPRPSWLRRAISELRRANERRRTAKALHALPDTLLRDIGMERSQINAYVTSKHGVDFGSNTEKSGGTRQRFAWPIRKWTGSDNKANDTTRVDTELLGDFDQIKGDAGWMPETLAEPHLEVANGNNEKAAAA